MGYTPSDSEINRALNPGVEYEMRQLAAMLRLLAAEAPTDAWVKNAAIESLLLKARILADFFEVASPDRYKDDVLAADFGFPPGQLQLTPALRNRINKDMAHLTYESVNRPRPEKDWEPADFLPLLTECDRFAEWVLSQKLANEKDERRPAWIALAEMIRYTVDMVKRSPTS